MQALDNSSKPEDVIADARINRQLGYYDDANAQYDKYAKLFSATDPTASDYADTGKRFIKALQSGAIKYDGGLYLSDVTTGGPGDAAGLKTGDVIVSYNGKTIDDMDTFTSEQSAISSGTVKLQYLRFSDDGNCKVIDATVPAGKLKIAMILL
jgi:C-terminal processing protease CtpA/Prc